MRSGYILLLLMLSAQSTVSTQPRGVSLSVPLDACCSSLWGYHTIYCSDEITNTVVCSQIEPTDQIKDMMVKVRRLLSKENLAEIASYWLPAFFVENRRAIMTHGSGTFSDTISRLCLYILMVQRNLQTQVSRSIVGLKNVLGDLEFTLTYLNQFPLSNIQKKIDIPVFAILRNFIIYLTVHFQSIPLPVSDACNSAFQDLESECSSENCDGRFVQPLFAKLLGVCGVQGMVKTPRIFKLLDSNFLPKLVRIRCNCSASLMIEDNSCECSAFHCPPGINKHPNDCSFADKLKDQVFDVDYVASLPQSRDMAAEVVRIKGPFLMSYNTKIILQSLAEWVSANNSTNSVLTMVEVGGHFGDASLLAASMFTRLHIPFRIFAYEPLTPAFQSFSDSIKVNNFTDTITLKQVGLGSQERLHVVMAYSDESTVHSTEDGLSPFVINSTSTSDVTFDTLDSQLSDYHDDIHVLIVHTNGAEVSVFQGAQELLRSRRVKNLKLRFYANAPYIKEGRNIVGQEKFNVLEELLRNLGCNTIYIPGGSFDTEVNTEGPVLARCG